ncbi:MAG: aldehyde dehydrogenase [Anaerolineaceae bacterium]|nr:aldehyde dehydrogenase [Anaerolineaceae bacterium]
MSETISLNVNGKSYQLAVDPETLLLYVLRNDLGLKGPKFGCGLEQCNSCKVLIDGQDAPSCQIPVQQVQGLPIITIEGLGTADQLHPLQEAFIAEQAIQCGYCASGMIIAAQGLLNRTRYPSDDEIRTALADNICRCGVYERVRRAIKTRIGRPIWEPIYEVQEAPELKSPPNEAKSEGSLSGSLKQTPELDAWIRISSDETITVFTGKAEIGQGIKTAVAQIAAEEMDVSLERIRIVSADTGQSPNEGVTAGSMSLQMSGNAIRQAAAEARFILLKLAFEELEAETLPESLEVVDGTITDPATGRSISYWQLFSGKQFNTQVTGVAQPKTAAMHQLVGQPTTRLDLPAKVTGEACYVHDMALPGIVHGRIVRPPAYDAQLVSVAETAVSQMPGVIKVVRDGRFLAVIAEREEQAMWAADTLRENAVWDNQTKLPEPEKLFDHLLSQPSQDSLVVDGTAISEPPPPPIAIPDDAAQTLQAAYFRPYHMHASLSPSAAVAQLVDDQLTVWSHSQGVGLLQFTIAQVLAMEPDNVRVIHTEGSGCYGHNGADDAALDAALLACAVPGKPVSLKWRREDEHTWEPYGTAMVMKMQASLNETGHITDWNHDIWSYPHSSRPRPGGETSGLLASWHRERPLPKPEPRPIFGYHFGDYRNADPLYALPQKRIVTHLVPHSPLRTSSLRSLGAYANVFAIESFMDELALAAECDPVEFRLRHLKDERARAVIEAAAEKANWQPRTQPIGNGSAGAEHSRSGRGIAFAQYKNIQCYTAVIVELTVDRENNEIKLQRAIIAADAGQIVNPDGLSNQLEGGFFQSASWTLAEQVTFTQQGITSQDWDTYPILRFSGAPVIEVVLLNRPDQPFLGSGEATQGPTPAAIANAVFDATGLRLRHLPLNRALQNSARS